METLSSSSELPHLPSKEEFANGLLRDGKQAHFLKKDDKYQLFRAIEEKVNEGHSVDSILAHLGIHRAAYFTHVWFTSEKAAQYEEELAEKAAKEAAPAGGAIPLKTKYKALTMEEKLAKIEEVARLRYVEGHNFDEACNLAGVRQDRFYAWSEKRNTFLTSIRRKKEKASRLANPRQRAEKQPRQRAAKEEIDEKTLDQRRQIIDIIHRKVRKGVPLQRVLKEKGMKSTLYHDWARQVDVPAVPKVSLSELWESFKDPVTKEDARTAIIEYFRGYAQRLAARHGEQLRSVGAFDVDEEMLVSVGLFEGVSEGLDVYDESRGTPIASYLGQKIALRMIDELRVQDPVSRLERSKEKATRNLRNEFFQKHNRFARTDEELTEYALSVGATAPHFGVHHTRSLDAEFKNADHIDMEETLNLYAITEDASTAVRKSQGEYALLVENIMKKCDKQEKEVLKRYYFDGLTMKEIGAHMDLSESRVSQIHTAIVERLEILLEDENPFRFALHGNDKDAMLAS